MFELCVAGWWCVVWWCECGVWCVVCGVWCVVCVVCGVWCMVCGVWCVVCGTTVTVVRRSYDGLYDGRTTVVRRSYKLNTHTTVQPTKPSKHTD